jgi:DNA-binding NarL/FixJ family response regulator
MVRSIGTVLVVEDDQCVRDLICQVLENAGIPTRTATTGEEAVDIARREQPRVVILDVHLPGISGYEVCRSLRDAFGDDLAVIFVSGARTEGYDRVAGLLIGADDYIAKPFAPDELVQRIRRLARRLAPTTRILAKRLTDRELDVLRLLALGMTQDAIAAQLVISPKTVATHIEHIFLKLGVQSRAQAVALAYRDDLLTVTGGDLVPMRSEPGAAVVKQIWVDGPDGHQKRAGPMQLSSLAGTQPARLKDPN